MTGPLVYFSHKVAAAGAPLPQNLAVSRSWPSGNPRTVIGECWVAEASSRGYVEVFIRPVLDQVAGIQGVLVTLRHELVHAAAPVAGLPVKPL